MLWINSLASLCCNATLVRCYQTQPTERGHVMQRPVRQPCLRVAGWAHLILPQGGSPEPPKIR